MSGFFLISADNGRVATSTDAVAWTVRQTPVFVDLHGSTYHPPSGALVVVGLEGTILTSSDDGETWAVQTSPTTENLHGVTWAEGLGLLIAVGASGSILTSTDGVAWNGPVTVGGHRWWDVAWSPSLGLLIAVAQVGTWMTTSTDGVTWTTPTQPTGTNQCGSIDWYPGLDRFVVTKTSNPRVAVSPDGVSWQAHNPSGLNWRFGSTYSPDLERLVVVGRDGAIAYTDDIDDTGAWVGRTEGSSDLWDVAWSPEAGLFFAIRRSSTTGTRSADGHSWQFTSGLPGDSFHIDWYVTNQPPTAPALDHPTSGATVDRTSTVRFRWTFDDPDDGDTQSQYQLQIREQGETASVVDVTVETPNEYHDLPGGTLDAGSVEWRVRTWDAAGEVGPWSGWEPFSAATPPPTPTITDPTDGQTIPSETYTLAWSTSEQGAYQARRVADDAGSPDTDTVLWDSGTVQSSGARSRTVEFPDNQQWEHVQLRIRRDGLWSPWASKRVEVSYTPPAVPTVTVTVHQVMVDGLLRDAGLAVSADHPTPAGDEPDVVSMDVHRRRVGESGDGIRVATGLDPGSTHIDFAVASGVEFEYRVRAVGENDTRTWSAWTP